MNLACRASMVRRARTVSTGRPKPDMPVGLPTDHLPHAAQSHWRPQLPIPALRRGGGQRRQHRPDFQRQCDDCSGAQSEPRQRHARRNCHAARICRLAIFSGLSLEKHGSVNGPNSYVLQATSPGLSDGFTPAFSVIGYTPQQIRAAYGISSLAQDGTGQTIAIVIDYDDPRLPSDLAAFDAAYGLPAPPRLTVLNQNGSSDPTQLPPIDPTGVWEGEETLDVEWAHAIAPAPRSMSSSAMVLQNTPRCPDQPDGGCHPCRAATRCVGGFHELGRALKRRKLRRRKNNNLIGPSPLTVG